MIHVLSEKKSILNQFIAEMRDVIIQKDSWRFRKNLERMGQVAAYEISQSFEYEVRDTETPLGISKSYLPSEDIVLCTILRAGLPLHNGLLSFFDRAKSSFISAYRQHHKDGTFEIKMNYVTCPNIKDSVLIVSDPMLATGASMKKSLDALLEYGTPKAIHVVTAIASASGISHIQRHYPDIDIWVGAVDEELTAKSYIVPGLGDAGDLAFGPKLQE